MKLNQARIETLKKHIVEVREPRLGRAIFEATAEDLLERARQVSRRTVKRIGLLLEKKKSEVAETPNE
jgi:hypothetical protein